MGLQPCYFSGKIIFVFPLLLTSLLAGSMVPFCMRVLHAELPMYMHDLHRALNRLCVLQNTTRQVLALVQAGRIPLSEEMLDANETEGALLHVA